MNLTYPLTDHPISSAEVEPTYLAHQFSISTKDLRLLRTDKTSIPFRFEMCNKPSVALGPTEHRVDQRHVRHIFRHQFHQLVNNVVIVNSVEAQTEIALALLQRIKPFNLIQKKWRIENLGT